MRLQREPLPDAPGEPAASRWTLRRIGAAFAWLSGYSLSGMWKVLRSSGIRIRAARVQAFSPDPEYGAKVEHLKQVLHQLTQAPQEIEVVFVDQMGYGRWPEAAAEWTQVAPGPRRVAERFGSNERKWRLMGALNARNGQVTALDNSIVGRKQVMRFLRRLDATYPEAKRMYGVLDNWSIHRHPDGQEALQSRPRLELVWLPTYAPWLNPIEKLWRWLRHDVLSLHRQAQEWDAFQQGVHGFLEHFATGSQEVLQYVGLLGEGLLAQARRGL